MSTIKAAIGRQRLTVNVRQSEANFTRTARTAMKSILDRLKLLQPLMEQATKEALVEAMEPVFEQSKYYCPKDTRALVSSADMGVGQFRGKTVLNLSYGKGGQPHYTAFVHENLDVFHKSPTQAKFLSQAVEEDIDGIESRLRAAYIRKMG